MATEKQGVFGITTARPTETPPARRPYLDEEKTSTSPQPQKPREGEKISRRNTLKKLGMIAGGIVLAGGAAEVIRRLFFSARAESNLPSTFDNSETEGIISKSNWIIINGSKAIEHIPTIPSGPNPKHNINLLIPIEDLSSSKAIHYNKDLLGKNDSNPIFAPESRQYAKDQNVKNILVFEDIPKGTVIKAPMDGLIEFVTRPELVLTDNINSINIFYKTEDNALHQISLFGKQLGVFRPTVEAKPYISGDNAIKRTDLWIPIKRGEDIAITLQETSVQINSMAWPSGNFGIEKSEKGGHLYPTNIKLITLPDPTSRQEKLVIIRR